MSPISPTMALASTRPQPGCLDGVATGIKKSLHIFLKVGDFNMNIKQSFHLSFSLFLKEMGRILVLRFSSIAELSVKMGLCICLHIRCCRCDTKSVDLILESGSLQDKVFSIN